MAKSKNKYYVVWVGKTPGIYDNWKDCQAQISGFPQAKYKGFKDLSSAEKAFKGTYDAYYQSADPTAKKANYLDFREEIIMDSLAVDAACSGNPGLMEYRGVNTIDGEVVFHKGPFEEGTNNIGEFLAIVHALAWFQKEEKSKQVIYTDSKTAMSWVRNKKVKSKLKKSKKNELLFDLIDRAVRWLESNSWDHQILKWNTEKWGEIPADFGRK
jgi:ribonuclease HI